MPASAWGMLIFGFAFLGGGLIWSLIQSNKKPE